MTTSSTDVEKLASANPSKSRTWDHILSTETASRKPSIMQALHQTLSNPGILSLGPGAPGSQYYPFDSIKFKSPSVGYFAEAQLEESGMTLGTNKYDRKAGSSIYDLSLALNYGQGTGSSQLLDFVTEHTKLVHSPPYQDFKCILSGGNTFALDLAFRTFTERGSYVLVDEYTYPTAFESAIPLGLRLVGIRIDEEGPIPEDLDEILAHWDQESRQGKKPHLLYTVPTGQNPTGATQSLQRRKDIYCVAQKHDLYILEDDPYYFIQMQSATTASTVTEAHEEGEISQESFIASLVPSFLRLDTDGRVFRMDSFSKIIAPGSRTGWVTASEQIIDCLVRAHETSLQNPSGFSQIMLFKLLHEGWGHAGLFRWLSYLQSEYTKRRNNMMNACSKYLPSNIVSWTTPKAGFFAWLKINWNLHPRSQSHGPRAIEQEIYERTIQNGALVVPGSWFQADAAAVLPNMYFRTTFASLPCEQMTEAIRRFGVAIRLSFGLDPLELQQISDELSNIK